MNIEILIEFNDSDHLAYGLSHIAEQVKQGYKRGYLDNGSWAITGEGAECLHSFQDGICKTCGAVDIPF